MANDPITIKVKGLDVVQRNMTQFSARIGLYVNAANKEAASEILDERGLRRYPPTTDANTPPTPYYVRGRGMQRKSGNDGKSERYGTQFYTAQDQGAWSIRIGNRASYAPFLTGDEQARAMARIGWRKLFDVAQEKVNAIKRIYDAWIAKAIRDLDLK